MRAMGTGPVGERGRARPAGRWSGFRSIEGAALAGLAHAACSLAGATLLLRAPTPSAGDRAAAEWYLDEVNQRTTLLGLNLVILGSIAFLWFVAVIRRRAGDRENRFFGTVFLGSALLLVGAWLVGALLFAVPALSAYLYGVAAETRDVALWQAGGLSMASVVAAKFEAVFILSTTSVARLAEALPRALIIAGYVVGLILMVAPLPSEALTWVFPTWVAAVSATLLLRRHDHPLAPPDHPQT